MSAKEPYNYFLLLRALFRSIGGGSHDLLYQEFLPLLPNLLQGKVASSDNLHIILIFCLMLLLFVSVVAIMTDRKCQDEFSYKLFYLYLLSSVFLSHYHSGPSSLLLPLSLAS